MARIFFTSDHHFDHANIIRFCNRPFKDTDEMNAVLIERWNSKINPGDDVYYLGDFSLAKERDKTLEILKALNGNKFLVTGNHEGAALNHRKRFQWVKDYYELKVKDPECANGVQRIILFHYAMRTWRGQGRGNWHLYGHSHGNLPDLEDQLCFDVGVDNHDFYPLSYEDVKAIMKTKKWEPPVYDR